MMTTHIDIELPQNLLDFIDYCARQSNQRRDDIIAEAIMNMQAGWKLEQGYIADKTEATEFAEASMSLFQEVIDEESKTE